jgi:D-3-phosphoglycerate dehydrogenase / 2-oxoglutarate reductase
MQCLIVDDIHPVLIQKMESVGLKVIYRPDFALSEDYGMLSEANILIIRSKFQVTSEILEQAPVLHLIGRAGAGLDNINLEEVRARDIEVVHAAEGNADAVGEHSIGLILGLLSKIASADRSVRQGEWKRELYRGVELKGKTVGLVGYGNMGRAVARRLSSFGCEVIAYDKYLDNWPDHYAVRVDLDTLKSESHILSLHIPLTNETSGMVDSDYLKSFRNSVFLINTSRGGIVKVEAVLELLVDGTLSGAALDVLEDEPPLKNINVNQGKYEQLFGRDDVLLTPHIAGWSLESYEKISRVLAIKIIDWLSQTTK